MNLFDRTIEEMREELRILFGNEVDKMSDMTVSETFKDLEIEGLNFYENDYNSIDIVDEEFDCRFEKWSG